MPIIKPSAKILEAMEIIGSPEKWTKSCLARDLCEIPVYYDDPTAVCFCSVGALRKVGASLKAHNYLYNSVSKHRTVPNFNDALETEHNEVMSMFMTAAFLALSEDQ